jgi:photosystem II stability/assembly factor-like uncharacterized protein
MSDTLLMIGTSKGLLLARSADRQRWDVGALQFPMNGVYAVAIDTRGSTPRLLASVDSSHWGPAVMHSDDLGASWAEPDDGALSFPKDTGAALRRAWALVASPTEPDVVWAGAEPSALFRSEDRGEHFTLMRGLWDHPHRESWGAGFGGQAIHTVLPDPGDADQLLVAMSTGGVYRSHDAGRTWAPSNTGVSAYFLPDPMPEFGQCVHKVARDALDPQRLFLQNHRGVYRSDDGGAVWTSIADGLPCDFGFAMVAHPSQGGVAYTFPVESDGMRLPPDRRCRVFRTADAGSSWTALHDGLPDEDYYGVVLRDAMCADDADPAGIYFGTRDGAVFASPDEGEHWVPVADHLPDVLCVRAAQV